MNAGPKPEVLIADDDPTIRMMLARMLSDIATVHQVGDGEQAKQFLESATKIPDLLILDVMMPHVDGLTLAKSLKHHPTLKRVPVLLLTARSSPMDVIVGINAGARKYMTKPFKREVLLENVKQLLRIR